jgi:hypothetical protein
VSEAASITKYHIHDEKAIIIRRRLMGYAVVLKFGLNDFTVSSNNGCR